MKKILNNLAKWLYLKTEQPQEDFMLKIQGHKLLQSKFLPEDTIMIGSKDYKGLKDFILDRKIKEIPD